MSEEDESKKQASERPLHQIEPDKPQDVLQEEILDSLDADPSELNASTRLSVKRTGLSTHRTRLSEHRTDLSEHRTELSEHRTELSEHRTDLSVLRSRLSAERTLMSWVRTAFSMISFGFSAVKFLQALPESGRISAQQVGDSPRNFGIILSALGLACILIGSYEHVRTLQQINELAEEKKTWSYPLVIALLVAIFGILTVAGIGLRVGPLQ